METPGCARSQVIGVRIKVETYLCFPSFHHIIARLFGCLEHIAKCALPHANYMLPCPLCHSTSSKVSVSLRVERQFMHRLFSFKTCWNGLKDAGTRQTPAQMLGQEMSSLPPRLYAQCFDPGFREQALEHKGEGIDRCTSQASTSRWRCKDTKGMHCAQERGQGGA